MSFGESDRFRPTQTHHITFRTAEQFPIIGVDRYAHSAKTTHATTMATAVSGIRQPVQVVVVSASVVFAICRIVIWRARTTAKKTVDRMQQIIHVGGPLVCPQFSLSSLSLYRERENFAILCHPCPCTPSDYLISDWQDVQMQKPSYLISFNLFHLRLVSH